MAEAVLPVFGAVETSINLAKTGFGMCASFRDALKDFQKLHDQANTLGELYNDVKTELEIIERSMYGRDDNEGNTGMLALDPNLFESLVQSTVQKLDAANGALKELVDRHSQITGGAQGTSSRRPWKRLHILKIVVLDASGMIGISSSLEQVSPSFQLATNVCTQIKSTSLILKRIDVRSP